MRIIPSFCFILFFALLAAKAQETSALQGGVRYGLSGNVGVNLHTVRFLSMPGGIRETIDNGAANLDYSYVSGVGFHGNGGVFAEFPLLSWLNLGVHLNFYDKSGLLESPIIATPAGRSDGTETTLFSSRKMDAFLQTIGPELIFGITPIQGLNLYAGLRGDFAFQKNYYQREEMQPETDGAFENGLRVRNELRGELPEVRNLGIANFNAALTGGFGVEFALGNTRAFSVELSVLGDVGAFNVFQRMDRPDDEWWRVNSLKAGLAVRYYPEREKALSEIESRLQRIQEIEKAVVSERTKIQEELKELKQSGLSASIVGVSGTTFSGKTISNPRITVDKTLVSRIIQWQPSITFNDASSIIPAAYKRISAQATKGFSTEQLCTQSAPIITSQTLNIVGKRLTEYPAASLTVICSLQEDTPTTSISPIAEARIRSVREYLQAVWNVAPERIQGKEVRLSPSEQSSQASPLLARTIVFQSNSPEILQPLRSESIVLLPNIASLIIEMDIRSGQGLKEWMLEISQFEDREIRTLGLFKGSKDFPRSIRWNMNEESGSLPSAGNPINIHVEATDIANRTIDAVPVEVSVDRDFTQSSSPRYRLEKYRIILEDNLENTVFAEYSSRQPDAQVRVIGSPALWTTRLQSQLATKLGMPPEAIVFIPSDAAKEQSSNEDITTQQRLISLEILEKIGK